MPGFKSTQIADTPVAYWTFDSDITGQNNSQIFDEIENANPLSITGTAYELEQISLNDFEVVDQASITFSNVTSSNTTNNTYMFCPHSSAFNFQDTGNGSFSIDFLFYKKNRLGDLQYNSNIGTPLIKKLNLIEISTWDIYANTDYIYVKVHTDKTFYIYDGDTRWGTIWNRINHIAVTYKCVQIDVNEYKATTTVFFNGHIAAQDVRTYIDVIPNSSVGAAFYVAGNGGNNAYTDWATETLKLDQIAIYDYYLTDEKIGNHYRKTRTYTQIITDSKPSQYYKFNEISGSTLTATVGTSGTKYGSFTSGEPGPGRDISGASTRFTSNGNASVTSYNQYSAPNIIMNTGQAYSVEFWFKAEASWNERGTFVSCFEENYEWDGLVIWLNTADNEQDGGRIQVSEDFYNYINSDAVDPDSGDALSYSDNEWHHLVVTRTSTTLSLYLDGILRGQKDDFTSYNANSAPSQLHLMGMPPGNFGIEGWMTEFVYYPYAMTEFQILNRWLYTLRYRLEGYTLLQGNPVGAQLRLYDHISGELLDEIQSYSGTGFYNYYPKTNRLIDVVAFIQDNNTTRYRIHGPIKPAEFTDDYGS